ncbi:MAG: hypothetical protein JOZ57_04145, partial [Abitibacteriaceae bacterium]|nr:hypothetical protein [Abditibacteriaceae bacterium]
MSTDHQESQAIAALQEQLAREVALREQAEQSCEQAEAALQELRDQFQAVLDAVPGGVSWINSDLQYLGINSRLASTYNLNPKDFIGRPIGFLSNSPGFTEFVR